MHGIKPKSLSLALCTLQLLPQRLLAIAKLVSPLPSIHNMPLPITTLLLCCASVSIILLPVCTNPKLHFSLEAFPETPAPASLSLFFHLQAPSSFLQHEAGVSAGLLEDLISRGCCAKYSPWMPLLLLGLQFPLS